MSRVRTYESRQSRRAARCNWDSARSGGGIASSPEKAMLAARGHEAAEIAARIACELELPATVVDRLRFAALFRDTGKLWISSRILEKEGPLTHAEWVEVRKHPETGARWLRAYGFDQEAEWVRYHHERPDGLGYPHGLVGDEIPLESRILAIADAWTAMRSDRPYGGPLGREEARRELEVERDAQFDAALVDVFLDSVEPGLGASLQAIER
jgi:HD-GYP domain-containing protein (c-di-GMP phosphodiesterase class II)